MASSSLGVGNLEKLPPELRLNIYEYVLDCSIKLGDKILLKIVPSKRRPSVRILHNVRDVPQSPHQLAITRVNKAMRHETKDRVFAVSKLVIHLNLDIERPNEPTAGDLVQTFIRTHPQFNKHVQIVEILPGTSHNRRLSSLKLCAKLNRDLIGVKAHLPKLIRPIGLTVDIPIEDWTRVCDRHVVLMSLPSFKGVHIQRHFISLESLEAAEKDMEVMSEDLLASREQVMTFRASSEGSCFFGQCNEARFATRVYTELDEAWEKLERGVEALDQVDASRLQA